MLSIRRTFLCNPTRHDPLPIVPPGLDNVQRKIASGNWYVKNIPMNASRFDCIWIVYNYGEYFSCLQADSMQKFEYSYLCHLFVCMRGSCLFFHQQRRLISALEGDHKEILQKTMIHSDFLLLRKAEHCHYHNKTAP